MISTLLRLAVFAVGGREGVATFVTCSWPLHQVQVCKSQLWGRLRQVRLPASGSDDALKWNFPDIAARGALRPRPNVPQRNVTVAERQHVETLPSCVCSATCSTSYLLLLLADRLLNILLCSSGTEPRRCAPLWHSRRSAPGSCTRCLNSASMTRVASCTV